LIGFEGAINRQILFSEEDVLREAMPYFRRTLGIDNIEVQSADSASPEVAGYVQQIVEAAEPGSPGIVLYNIDA
jgi:leucyl-tRNA synthetase